MLKKSRMRQKFKMTVDDTEKKEEQLEMKYDFSGWATKIILNAQMVEQF